MNRVVATCCVLILFACKGEAGPQGPIGPTGPPAYDRGASYCNSVNTNVGPGNSWTLTATCTNIPDLPIHGWCFEPLGLPAGAFRSVDGPVDWADTTKAAGWTCSWSWSASSTPAPFQATVEICCATPG